jgi:hypothetical protein
MGTTGTNSLRERSPHLIGKSIETPHNRASGGSKTADRYVNQTMVGR